MIAQGTRPRSQETWKASVAVAFLASVSAAVAAPAVATARELPPVAGGDSTLTIDVTGSVVSQCGAPIAPPSLALTNSSTALLASGSASFNITLSCNAPFRLRAVSANGALVLQDNQPGSAVGLTPGKFTNSVPYTAALTLNTDRGAISQSCDSATLVAIGSCAFAGAASGQGLSSGDGVAMGLASTLAISWGAQDGVIRRAGAYADSITIAVEVRP